MLEWVAAGTVFAERGSPADFLGELVDGVVWSGRGGAIPAGIDVVTRPVWNQVI